MNKIAALVLTSGLVLLTACGASSETGSASADDFAARINGGEDAAAGPAPEATNTPTVAAPLPGAAEGAFSPGTATDPESSTCGANLMGDFIGKPADDATRLSIMEAANGKAGSVRFVLPGSEYVNPDPTNPRLSIMIDNLGVIRDARCG